MSRTLACAEIRADEARELLAKSGGTMNLYLLDELTRTLELVGKDFPMDGEFSSECYLVSSSRPALRLLDVVSDPVEFRVFAVVPGASGEEMRPEGELERLIDGTMPAKEPAWQCPVCGAVLDDRHAYEAHVEWCVEGRG